MHTYSSQPAVIGAGLSGMVISRALSRAGVPHLLLGDAPTSTPRLGESLSLDASLALLSFFPELSKHYFWKKRVVSYVGEWVGACNVELDEFAARTVFKLLGYRPIDALLHVDRIGLDGELFEAVVADPNCHHLESRVSEIEYDSASDRVQSFQLDSGEVVAPSVVFDATNHIRLVGQAAEVPCDITSDLQRVAFTHLHLADDDPDDGPAKMWRHATSLLRLYRDLDDLEGGAWCIPLGRYVSIGVSMQADEDADVADEEILERVHRAFERRGLDYRRRFVNERGPLGMKHRYFRHERAWGANWLLVGPSSCQVWWPSSTAVGTALAAANVAADFSRDPAAVGPLYATYMSELDPAHYHLNWFMTQDTPPADTGTILRHLAPLIRGHLVRLSVFSQMHTSGLSRLAGRLIYRVMRKRTRGAVDCQFRSVGLADQTATLYQGAGL